MAYEGYSIYNDGDILEVRYSDVEGTDPWPGEGNVNVIPQFLDDGYHLYGMTSLLNAGITEISISGEVYNCPAYDIDGEARPYHTQPEIGADEVTFVSVNESIPVNGLAIEIYPNPCTELLTIACSNGVMMDEIILYNHNGQEIMHQLIAQPNAKVEFSALPAGVYLLKVIAGNTIQKEKIVKR